MEFLGFFTNRRFWGSFFVGVLFGCLVLGVLWFLKLFSTSIPFDFLNHYQASEVLLSGRSPYIFWELSTKYNYPPTVFIFIFWLSFFKIRQAFIIWQVFSVLALLVSAILMTRIVQISKRTVLAVCKDCPCLGVFLFFLGFLVFFPTRFGFLMGQINNFVLLALCLFFWNLFSLSYPKPVSGFNEQHCSKRFRNKFGMTKNRDSVMDSRWSGLWLAIAVCLKLAPAIFVPYLFLKGHRRALVSFFSVLMLFFLLSGMFFGFGQYFLWWERIRPPLFSITGKSVYYNQALSGLAARAVGENRLGEKLTLFLETMVLVFTFSLIQIAVFLKKFPRLSEKSTPGVGFLEVSLLLTTMLLVNRLTWQHHLVWVLPAFVFAATCFIKRKQWFSLGVLGFCFLLLNHNFISFLKLETRPFNWLYLSHGTWGLLGLWGLLIKEISFR